MKLIFLKQFSKPFLDDNYISAFFVSFFLSECLSKDDAF